MAGIESLMWGLESDPRIRTGVAAVLLLDGPLDIDALRQRLAELAATNPRLRSTIGGRALPLTPLRWIELDSIDVDDHLHQSTAMQHDELMTHVARIIDAPYEADRPLWDVHVIGKFEQQRSAIVVRLHHCITDGLGSMMLAAQFLDADAAGTRLIQVPDAVGDAPGARPGRFTALTSTLRADAAGLSNGARQAGGQVVRQTRAAAQEPIRALQGGRDFAQSTKRLLQPLPNQLSEVLQPHAGRTSVATVEVELAGLKAAGRALGGTVNDVFMTALSRGLYEYHVATAGNSVSEVRVCMAVNSRALDDTSVGGNQFVPVRVRLPLSGGDLRDSLRQVQEVSRAGKQERAIGIAPTVSALLGRLPARLGASAVTGMYHGVDVGASNFPGPPVPLWVAGTRIANLYAVGPRSGGAFGATMITYNGTAHISLNMDAGAVRDPALLRSKLQESLDQLSAVAAEAALV